MKIVKYYFKIFVYYLLFLSLLVLSYKMICTVFGGELFIVIHLKFYKWRHINCVVVVTFFALGSKDPEG